MAEHKTQEARRMHKHAQNRELLVSLVFLLFLEGRRCGEIAELFSISESSARDHVSERCGRTVITRRTLSADLSGTRLGRSCSKPKPCGFGVC